MVYVMLANGFEEIEALAFTDILRRAEIDAKLVSVYNDKIVTGSHGIAVVADLCVKDVDYNNITAVVLPGGLPGTYNLRDSDAVKNILEFATANNKLIGAICAAPYVFDYFGYLDGKKSTVNPGFKSEMKNAELIDERVVIDGNIITSQGPGTAHEFAGAFISILKGENESQSLLNEMLYK